MQLVSDHNVLNLCWKIYLRVYIFSVRPATLSRLAQATRCYCTAPHRKRSSIAPAAHQADGSVIVSICSCSQTLWILVAPTTVDHTQATEQLQRQARFGCSYVCLPPAGRCGSAAYFERHDKFHTQEAGDAMQNVQVSIRFGCPHKLWATTLRSLTLCRTVSCRLSG